MTYPKYFVSYTVMDSIDAGANPFHHAFLTFSKQDTEDKPVYVENAYGFYSQPAKTNFFWQMIGINFKLQNSHGILKQEKFHELDRPGYTAKHFEVSNETYLAMIKDEKNQIRQEQEAIEDAVRSGIQKAIKKYNAKTIPKITEEEEQSAITAAIAEYKKRPDKNIELKQASEAVQTAIKAFYKEHAEEIQPETIYQNELKNKTRKSRLQRFEFRFDLDFNKGFHTCNSYTCKTQALDLLETHELIKRTKPRTRSFSDLQSLEHKKNKLHDAKPRSQSENDLDEQRCEIDTNDFGFAFPNTSDEKLNPLFLFSNGELCERKNPKGSYTDYFRKWEQAQLVHALQPNLMHPMLHQIQQELLALKRLDKQLRQPKDEEATKQMRDAQAPLWNLIERFSAIDNHTDVAVVEQICKDSQAFRKDFAIKQPEVSASFTLLSWETLLSGTLTLSALAIVIALNCMSAGLPFIATVTTASVVGLVSCFGLFGGNQQQPKTPPTSGTQAKPIEQQPYFPTHQQTPGMVAF